MTRTARCQRCFTRAAVGTLPKPVLFCLPPVTDSVVSSLCHEQMKSSDIDQELFTESYCKVCSAQLISESQRVAHYEVGCSLVTLPRGSVPPPPPAPATASQQVAAPALKAPL